MSQAAKTLFCDSENLPLFRTLLLEKLGWQSNAGNINQIPQWVGFLRGLGELGDAGSAFDRVWLEGGYFYGFHNPVPPTLSACTEAARREQVNMWLVPTVPDSEETQELEQNGFEKVPAYVESTLSLEGDLDATLRANLGSRRYRNFLRVTRQAEARFSVEFLRQADLLARPELVELAGSIHAENTAKYGYPFNMYDGATLTQILHSPLGKHLAIGFVREKETGNAVQVILTLVDEQRAQLHYLALGIRHEAVPAIFNLYTASYMWLYRFGVSCGVTEFYLGRGMQDAKRRVGANHFALLNHWLKSSSPEGRAAIAVVAENARRKVLPAYLEIASLRSQRQGQEDEL